MEREVLTEVDFLLESEPLGAGNDAHYGTLTKIPSTETREAGQSDEEALLGLGEEHTFTAAVQVWSIISALLLGEFIGSMDATLIIAAGPTISSEFQRLQDLSWLSSSYTLGVCLVQPLVGKISDIFGRKQVLLVTYVFFAAGCFLCGFGTSMNHVIAGRAISGLGGGGMMTMSSIVISDLVPKRDIATYRGYVNLSLTLGRGLGGPIGGALTDFFGWRWLFHLQGPLILLQAVLVLFNFKSYSKEDTEDSVGQTLRSKIKRVDFLGSACLSLSILSGMLLLELGGQKVAWNSPVSYTLGGAFLVLGVAFVLTEQYIAPEPIFSLHLLKNPDVVLSYIIATVQLIAQAGLQFFVPLYFQVTSRASPTAAGAQLVPAVVGNSIGGLMSGFIVKKTGRYKYLLLSSGLIAAIAYSLLYLRWNGHTNFWESLYVIPGGLGSAMGQAATFMSMTAAIDNSDMAMATSGMYLMMHVGIVLSFTGNNALLNGVLEKLLKERLNGPDAAEIIENSLSDARYIWGLEESLQKIIISSYVSSIHWTHLVSIICALISVTASMFVKDRQL